MKHSASALRPSIAVIGSVALAGVGVALIWLLPWIVTVSWSAIGACLAHVSVPALIGLVLLWFLGLAAHGPVQMMAMPGLTWRQAITLNLCGSAVSNVLPMGGPAGMGLGYAIARRWGFSADRFASYVVATNLWNAVAKFVVALALLGVATVHGTSMPSGLGRVILSASVFLGLAAGAAITTFRTERATDAIGQRLDRVRIALRRSPTERDLIATWLRNSRRELTGALRRGWISMSVAEITYIFLQAALLYACLAAVGAGAGVAVVAVAFAVERLISLAPVTPGAAGLAEIGTVAALTSSGVGAVAAASAVLLYRILMLGFEVLIGGALTFVMVWLRRGPDRKTAASADSEGSLAASVRRPLA